MPYRLPAMIGGFAGSIQSGSKPYKTLLVAGRSQRVYNLGVGSQKKNFWLWLPPLVWMSVIFRASSISSYPEHITGPEWPGRVAHLGEYGILSLLYLIALRGTSQLNKLQLFLISIVLTTLYGISDEIHQLYVPGRSAEAFDILLNFMGAVGGAVLFSIVVVVLSTREPAT